jgi:hypothetical protein
VEAGYREEKTTMPSYLACEERIARGTWVSGEGEE